MSVDIRSTLPNTEPAMTPSVSQEATMQRTGKAGRGRGAQAPLDPSDQIVTVPLARGADEHRRWSRVHRMPESRDRWRERSRTFRGIAAAMADQWGGDAPDERIAA
jgi:hypothetical protein